jgi:prepilin-type N-terminal cleavage/methylation domain-containing protein
MNTHNRTRRAFTVTEVLVTVVIIAVVLGLTLSVYQHAVRLSRQTACVNNLRQVALALSAYQTQERRLPDDSRPARFDAALLPYLKERAVLHCPEDGVAGASSYAPYYVCRRELSSWDFILGCPRHGSGQVATVLFGNAAAKGGRLGAITHNGKPVKIGDRVTGGVLRFADGSAVALGQTTAVDVVTSFQRGDATYYTVLRLPTGADGALALNVNPNSRLEVVAPGAIAGSEGTTFYVVHYGAPSRGANRGLLAYVVQGKVRLTASGQVKGSRLLTASEVAMAFVPGGTVVSCQAPPTAYLPTMP